MICTMRFKASALGLANKGPGGFETVLFAELAGQDFKIVSRSFKEILAA